MKILEPLSEVEHYILHCLEKPWEESTPPSVYDLVDICGYTEYQLKEATISLMNRGILTLNTSWKLIKIEQTIRGF